MKPPAGHAQPRRKAAQKQVRLDLRRTERPPSPEEEIEKSQKGNFWKWFGLIALFHLLLFVFLVWLYRPTSKPPAPTEFMNLMPEGVTAQGTPGTQAAPKLGATTAAPVHHHNPPKPPVPTPPRVVTPPPPPVAVQPKPPVPEKKADIKNDVPALVKVKPRPPKPPHKVKVDLHLAAAPDADQDTPTPKPKHVKKKVHPAADDSPDTTDRDTPDSPTMGLSREQVAAKLGEKLKEAGIEKSTQKGPSGASGAHANRFADFYASIQNQFMDKWQAPGVLDPNAIEPAVQIHVERDGHVPPDRVTLLRSSGNATLDESALAAARSLGYLLEPLPEGCPPDISINLKLNQ